MNRTLYPLALILILFPNIIFSQVISDPEIVFGLQRFLSQSNYLQNYHIPEQTYQNTDIKNGWGIKGDLLLPSKRVNNLGYVIGIVYQNASYNDFDADDDSGLVPHLFGGGLYLGLSAKAGVDEFGVIGQICPGYFVFNQKVNHIAKHDISNNYTLINNTTSSLGGKLGLTFYRRHKNITIYPGFYCIIMGASNKGANALFGIDLSFSYKQ